MFLGLLVLLAGVLSAQTNGLPFRPISAEYSNALDRIIMTSSNPNELHIFNPATRADTKVALSKPPLSLSVSPDGWRAAVGHELLITYVNLSSGTVEKTITTSLTVGSIALGPEWIYAAPPTSPGNPVSVPPVSIRISNGSTAPPVNVNSYVGSLRLHPGGGALYGSYEYYLSGLVRYDVSTGPITTQVTGSSIYGCGTLWLTPDRDRMYTGCGTVHRLSATAAQNLSLIDTPFGSGRLTAFAQSDVAGRVYVVPQDSSSQDSERVVLVHEAASLRRIGAFRIPSFQVSANTFAGRGKWVFTDQAGTSLYVVYQADTTSGLLLDFALQHYPLSNAPACTVTPAAATAIAAYTGGTSTVNLTAAADCVFQATTQTPWITLVSGAYGSGNSTLSYLVRPNSSTSTRTGTIAIGSQSLTITQDAAPATLPATRRLGYSIVQADYAKPQDRLVFVTASPDELHVYNPATGVDQFVALPYTPASVSVRPDGLYAAVGYNAWISYVNLQTLAVERTFEVAGRINAVALAANGYIFASGNGTPKLYALAVSSGTVSSIDVTSSDKQLRLHPSGNYLFLTSYGITKYDIRSGAPQRVREAGTSCQQTWVTEDGLRLLTSCGSVLRSSDVPQEDFQSNGTLSAASGSVQWAAHSSAQQSTAVLPSASSGSVAGSEIQLYGDASLELRGRLRLPNFPGSSAQSRGTAVFWRSDSSALDVILQAEPVTAAGEAALARITPGEITACTYSASPTSANVPGAGGTVTVNVSTGANCLWSAVNTQLNWVSVSTSPAVGSGSFTIQISPNDRTTSRSGSVLIANQATAITQAGAIPSLTLSPYYTNVPASGGTSFVFASSNVVDYPWTVTSNASWITAQAPYLVSSFPVNLTIQPNTGPSRSGSVTIGNQTFVVIQTGTGGYASLTLNPASSQLLPGSASSATVSVTSNVADFNWFAISTTNWITITAGATATGNGQVTYAVAANPAGSPRTGAILIGDRSYLVQQAGSGTLTLNPSTVTVGPGGASGTIQVTATPSDYSWGVTAGSVNWVFLSPTTTTGSGTINYSVTQNSTSVARTATLTIGGATLTITQSGAATGLRFVPVVPCRVFDSRLPVGPFGSPRLGANTPRDIPIQQSGCAIPSSAQAYALNVTVVPRGPLSFLTLWPATQARPLVSTLNSFDGRVLANAAIVPAGVNGAISAFATDETDLILDIAGYFAPVSATATLQFYPVRPCRVSDTRNAVSILGGPILEAGTSRDIPVPLGNCGVPATAAAYSVNVTAVPAGPLSFLTTWPTGQARPNASTLNSFNGAVVANAAIVPAGANGGISVFVTDRSHVVVDINGYFAPPSASGLQFYGLSPCRVLDTRLGAPYGGPRLNAGQSRNVPVAGSACTVPATAQAYSLNATVVPSSALSYLTLWPAGQTQAVVSTLNSFNGAVVANAALVPAGTSGSISAFATDATELILDINGYFAP